MHLVLNMYILLKVGRFAEHFLGRLQFALVYLTAGVLGSLASYYWNLDIGVVSAGASGAIFGIFGVLAALLFSGQIPELYKIFLGRYVGLLLVINLLNGFRRGNIDHAGHIGGANFRGSDCISLK